MSLISGLSKKQVVGLVALQAALVGSVALVFRLLENYSHSDRLPKPPQFESSYTFPEFIDMVVTTVRKQNDDEEAELAARERHVKFVKTGTIAAGLPLVAAAAVTGTVVATRVCVRLPELARFLPFVPSPLLRVAFAIAPSVTVAGDSKSRPLTVWLVDRAAAIGPSSVRYLRAARAVLRVLPPGAALVHCDAGGRSVYHAVADALHAGSVALQTPPSTAAAGFDVSDYCAAVAQLVDTIDATLPPHAGALVAATVAPRASTAGGAAAVAPVEQLERVATLCAAGGGGSSAIASCARVTAARWRKALPTDH